MKKVKCSGCRQVLGVPRKFFGKKVTCPNCKKLLIVSFDEAAADGEPEDSIAETDQETAAGSKTGPQIISRPLTMRSLPTPPAPKAEKTAANVPDAPAPTEMEPGVEVTASLIDEPTPKLTPNQDSVANAASLQNPATRPATKPDAQPVTKAEPRSGPVASVQHGNLQTEEPGHDAAINSPVETAEESKVPQAALKSAPTASQTPSQPVTARIIKAADLPPDVDDVSELPTLQLREDRKPGPKLAEKKTSPVFLGVLLCGSLICSGLILVFGDFQPRVNQRVLENARQELTRFYEVRIDIPLKPYQIYLREAQLANSRGDRDAEIEAYRNVMKQFRAEDRNKFVGVTGSPAADAELERLVSIMLGNGQEDTGGLFR